MSDSTSGQDSNTIRVLVSLAVVLTTVSAWWKPHQHTTWQWQLENDDGHLVKTYAVDMYDIDLFDTSESDIQYLKHHGRKVICYFSAGSYEAWRPDHHDFPSSVLGHGLDGWDERWLDIRTDAVRNIMKKRLDLAVQKGCDGVEPDNVDVYSLSTSKQGFHTHIDEDDQLDFNKFIAKEAHARDLSVGLKNDVDQIHELQSYFDWALNEECMDFDECDKYQPFIDHHKPVFHVQYSTKSHGSSTRSHVCHASSSDRPHQFMTLIKEKLVTDWRLAC
ncbi:uncharacterized protein LOC110466811 [Mizuhopecten yessoensis]|nr:uncharacterized protein LOC110466811 [Mizuhopecten yessoensis]